MKTALIAWRKLSRRSTLLARALDAELFFFKDRLPYLRAIWKTHFAVRKAKPDVVIVQLPQGPLLLQALILRGLMGCKVVADVHTGFLLNKSWKEVLLNGPFKSLLSRADLVLAHNEPQLTLFPKKIIPKTIVVYDQWQLCEPESISVITKGNYLVFPASFAPDEPLKEVIEAVETVDPAVKLYVTGNWKRQPQIKTAVSERVVFTGYLPENEFDHLIAGAGAIITGTKRENTTLMSGWEAVAYQKPLALTETTTLKSLFKDYAVFYDWKDPMSIIQAIKEALNEKPNVGEYLNLRRRTVDSIMLLKRKLTEFESS